ncbi:RHS repeat-associated core domain-containing protein [Austwickia sp. TVS 96-490-7B]|uniref:RHS repeat-associated core domain-containing protein n=1 Tax=Austwickia sp. TVS 96-490-7B TaxID=2830843 RepID=UPI001C59E841
MGDLRFHAGGQIKTATGAGLTRFGVRWYNPNTGRFDTPDPSGKEKNNHLYTGGNTCNRVDPTEETSGTNYGCNFGGAVMGILAGWGADAVLTGSWDLSVGWVRRCARCSGGGKGRGPWQDQRTSTPSVR